MQCLVGPTKAIPEIVLELRSPGVQGWINRWFTVNVDNKMFLLASTPKYIHTKIVLRAEMPIAHARDAI